MNTKLSSVKAYNKKDNLIVLTDKSNLSWAKDLLSKDEVQYLKSALKKDILNVVFPKANNIIVVQALNSAGTHDEQREEARIFGSEALNKLEQHKTKKVTIVNKRKQNHVLDFIEGIVLANYQFLKYFSDKKEKKHHLESIQVTSDIAPASELRNLMSTCEAVCVGRDLVNEPLSYLTAAQLSLDIKKLGKSAGFKVTVFDEKKIKALKMGGLLAVNAGSFTPPRFNILEYKPKKKAKNTGGLSLKPTANSMDRMKADMGGAASVVGTFVAIAKAKLPIHVIGLIPATDNRPGNNAYAPGDVIKMYDGSTVEVLNTDAEGRMILADALHYAKRYKPELVLDFATLTGAAVRSVGTEGISMMANASEAIKNKIKKSGFSVHERIIEFPLWKEYGEQMKSNIADLKNLGGPYAGHITAAKFLEHFTGKEYPWVHFDIAGHAYLTRANAYRPKEGTGAGVRLMFDFLKNY
jgi:leucyl aminopeptidase